MGDLVTIAELLERFRGKIGRKNLTAHLHQVPYYNGGPTHRRNGKKYLFTEADIERLVASFEPQAPARPAFGREDPPLPSADRAYRGALALLDRGKKTRAKPPR